MPYIKKEEREDLKLSMPDSAGQLNYEFTNVINSYLMVKTKNYQTINDILGALEAAKLEFYRRVVVPYEDSKIKENGDVY